MNWSITIDPKDIDTDYVEAVVEGLQNGDTLQSWLDECHADRNSMDSTAGNAVMILLGYKEYLRRTELEWGEIGPESNPA
ncbi:MAG: hypothetical protein KGR25_00060 [Chloroflexi bacterium]|nr:hypothetical protein [Chloroflexota bacterium]